MEVRINMKCHRGINQCNVNSVKIIEVRSNGRKVRSNGMEVRSNGMEVRSNGMEIRSNGMEIRSNGMEVRSNGIKVAIRLHFCPQCPSIRKNLSHDIINELVNLVEKEILKTLLNLGSVLSQTRP